VKASRLILIACAAATLTIVHPASAKADGANFAGTWAITGTLVGDGGKETIAPTCTFKVSGEQLSGSCKSGNAMGSIDGSVSGSSIVWHWDRIATADTNVDATLTFRGQVGDDGILRGEFKDSNYGDNVGTFVGLKAK
jgi:hypothetical protein